MGALSAETAVAKLEYILYAIEEYNYIEPYTMVGLLQTYIESGETENTKIATDNIIAVGRFDSVQVMDIAAVTSP